MKKYLKERGDNEKYKKYSKQFVKFYFFNGYVFAILLLDLLDAFELNKNEFYVQILYYIRNEVECTMYPILCVMFCINKSIYDDIKSIICCQDRQTEITFTQLLEEEKI